MVLPNNASCPFWQYFGYFQKEIGGCVMWGRYCQKSEKGVQFGGATTIADIKLFKCPMADTQRL
jgi:hypothetical protein